MSLAELVRESGGEFGMAVGRGNIDGSEPDKVIDVQVFAQGETAVILVAILEWLEENEWPDDALDRIAGASIEALRQVIGPAATETEESGR